MPRVPFSYSHRKGVDGLVQLIQNSNSLDDMVVVTLNRELDLGTGVSVTKTQLSGIQIALSETFQKLCRVQSDASKHILHDFTGVSGFALDGWESGLDARCQDTVVHTQADLLLLACLGKVEFKERNKSLRSDTFGNVVNLAKCLLVVPGNFVRLSHNDGHHE
jgi:hypothetical protein